MITILIEIHASKLIWSEGAFPYTGLRSGNKHRHEDTDKGFWPLDFLGEGPDCLSKFSKKSGGGADRAVCRLLKRGDCFYSWVEKKGRGSST